MLNRISKIKSTAIALLIIASLGTVEYALAQKSRTSNNLVPQQSSNDAATVLLRAGRDLITDGEWMKAQEKFDQYVNTYPGAKDGDVALYWKAYAEQKLGKFDKCRESVNMLSTKYPKSTWIADARSLLVQMSAVYPAAAQAEYAAALTLANSMPARVLNTDVVVLPPQTPTPVFMGSGQNMIYSESIGVGSSSSSSAADDDPCEFKIVVLQALFQTDVQRGIVAATDWLKPNSGQTVRCKQAALSLLGRNGGKAVTPVLLDVAKSDPDVKLRARAISTLGATNEDSVIDALRDFALNSQEPEIVEASLYALSRHTGERSIQVLSDIAISSKLTTQRKVAISSIASRPGEPAVDALLKIYDADQTLDIRKAVIGGFGNRKSERAGTKLFDIARGSDNIELRKSAISAISRRGGDKAVEFLLNLYDSEKNEELKDQIVNALASGSTFWTTINGKGFATATGSGGSRVEDQRVVSKLIEIAKSPQTPMERRKRAIGWLSRSKDPQVLKFLEDLLK
jgi:HEAT repeat protein